MLFKHSIRSLLLIGIAAANVSAQSPLWFEKAGSAATSSTGPNSPLVTAQGAHQPTWLTETPWDNENLRKRAVAKLRKPPIAGEQPTAPKPGWSQKTVQVKEVPRFSIQLTSQALQSGETVSDYRWPTTTGAANAGSYLSVAANEAAVAPRVSLIMPTGNRLAFWQTEDEARKKKDKEAETGKKSGEESTDAKSTDSSKPSTKKPKFDTASMVGPLTSPQQLFSMLDVAENFQTYAEPVHSARSRDLDSQKQAAFTNESYVWISPVFYHKPLYFEQPNLERYGNGTHRWLQPIASSVHFFGTIPLMPYKMLTQHPCEKHYTLGNRRPGNCNPVQRSVILGTSYLGEVREYWRPGSGY